MDVQTELLKFITTYKGRGDVGDTPQNKGQCVGVPEVWIDTFSYPHIWGNAKDLLKNADPNFYEIIYNSPNNFPQAGDIMILNWGEFGHTGVALSGADANQYSMFEQNDHMPSDPSGLCEIMQHNYNGVLGWIRFKNLHQAQTPIPPPPVTTPVVEQTISLANYNKLKIQYDTVKQELDTLQNTKQPEINNYHAMQALGYNTVDDITISLQKKEDLIVKLQQEQVLLERKNEQLATTIAEDSKNNYTGMEKGIEAMDRIRELEDYLMQIQKTVGVNQPGLRNVLSRVAQLKDYADRFISKLEEEKSIRQLHRQAITNIQQVQQNGVDWLMNAFRLTQKDKEVK